MNIIVSGASGFLGRHLCPFLESLGHQITRLNSSNCDLCQDDALKPYSSERYDYIFHLAAWTQAGDFCLKHAAEQWVINQRINTNMLDWWQKQQGQAKLIFMGTSCAYAPGTDLREENYMLGEPIEDLYTYAMTKRMLLQGARAMQRQYGLRWLCAVPSTLYGSGYHLDGRQMHFIFDLVRKIIRGKVYGEPVILWGDGWQKRELILVDDFIKILWTLTEKYSNEIFNIGAGQSYSIRDFAGFICEQVGYPAQAIKYDSDRYQGAKNKCLNVEKVQKRIPEYSLTELNQGLSQVIQWFYDNNAY